MMKTTTFFLLAFITQACFAAGMSTTEAFNAGTTFGKDNIQGVKGQISTTKATTSVPNYTSTSSESSYYQGGKGSLSAPASGQVTGCTSTTGKSDPDAATHGKCESVRMIMKDPGKKDALYPINKNTDPLMTKRNTVRDSAEAYLGLSAPTGSYSGCTEKTTTTPDQYITESCNEWPQKTQEQKSCFKTAIVTIESVQAGNCPQGTWIKHKFDNTIFPWAQVTEFWQYCDNSRPNGAAFLVYTTNQSFGYLTIQGDAPPIAIPPNPISSFNPTTSSLYWNPDAFNGTFPKALPVSSKLGLGIGCSHSQKPVPALSVVSCSINQCTMQAGVLCYDMIRNRIVGAHNGTPFNIPRPGYQTQTTIKVGWDNGCAALESQVQP